MRHIMGELDENYLPVVSYFCVMGKHAECDLMVVFCISADQSICFIVVLYGSDLCKQGTDIA